MPHIPEKCKLLHGPYHAPPLSRGDRATCLLRDGDVVITGWTNARIPWPRCRVVGVRGGSGVLLDEELARAVRTESAAAICFWWRVHPSVVWRWRRALGVTTKNNPRSYQLLTEASQAGADAVKVKEWTDQECDAKARTAKQLNLGRYLTPGYHGPRWTAKQRKMLGKLADEEVARRTGRTVNAVQSQRNKLGIANPAPLVVVWTAEEIALLGTAADEEIGKRIGRTAAAVTQKRSQLGIPTAQDRRRRQWAAK